MSAGRGGQTRKIAIRARPITEAMTVQVVALQKPLNIPWRSAVKAVSVTVAGLLDGAWAIGGLVLLGGTVTGI